MTCGLEVTTPSPRSLQWHRAVVPLQQVHQQPLGLRAGWVTKSAEDAGSTITPAVSRYTLSGSLALGFRAVGDAVRCVSEEAPVSPSPP